MWNLVGFMVMVGVVYAAKWFLRVWDSIEPLEDPVPADTKRRAEIRAS
ncbi:MAG: hypothetical protein ACT4QG_00555 [Sporichthyaceae bacterium]